jgi:uncharacterized membrane protein
MRSGKDTLVHSPAEFTAFTAVMTALVTLATMIIQIPIPATKGLFNLGDSMVYVSALLFGPYVGAFAGGVGSMLSDVLTGYVIYAPATLIIKGVEGFVVGILSQRFRQGTLRGKGRQVFVLTGLVTATYVLLVLVDLLGITYFTGSGSIPSWVTELVEDPTIWVVFSLLMALVIGFVAVYVVYRSDVIVLFILVGGAFMVSGYFLYELLIIGIAAIVEVPINVLQVLSGIVIALPINRGVRQAITI